MATILNTTQVYNAADVVTHTNLNQIVGGTTFVAGVNGATDDISLEVDTTSGSLQIKDNGVTTVKLPDSTDKTDGVTFPKIQHIDTNKVLGRTSANEGDVEEVDIVIGATGDSGVFFDNDDMLDNSDTAGGSATRGATQQSIKAYIDKLKPNISQFVKSDIFASTGTNDTFVDFGFEVSITPKFSNSELRYTCNVSNSTNDGNHGNQFILMKRVGPASNPPVPEDFSVVSGAVGDLRGNRTQCFMQSNYPVAYGQTISAGDFIDTSAFVAGTEITYKLMVSGYDTTDVYINRPNSDNNNDYVGTVISTCTAEEIYK